MVFDQDSTFCCDIFTLGNQNKIYSVILAPIFQPVHIETFPFPLSNTSSHVAVGQITSEHGYLRYSTCSLHHHQIDGNFIHLL